jgi:uncharacterized membrane protein (DUF106 family)
MKIIIVVAIVVVLVLILVAEYLFDRYYADKLKDMARGFGISDKDKQDEQIPQ